MKLETIAAAALTAVHWGDVVGAQHLRKGLWFALETAGDELVLELWRNGRVGPSDQEIAVCRRCFGVPGAAVVERSDPRVVLHWTPQAPRRQPLVRVVRLAPAQATEPLDLQPARRPPLDESDPWVKLQRHLLAEAERAGKADRVAWYRQILRLDRAE